MRRVIAERMGPVAAGALTGLPASLVATRLLEGLLYDIPLRDPASLGAGVAVLW